MSDFFKCDCVRTWRDAIKWCNVTVHLEFMVEVDHDGCDGHDRQDGFETHCTSYSVDDGDVIQCTMCNFEWVHSDDE